MDASALDAYDIFGIMEKLALQKHRSSEACTWVPYGRLDCSDEVVAVCTGSGAEQEAASVQALRPASAAKSAGAKAALCKWQRWAEGDGLELVHQHSVKHVTWHARGEYFASVAPTGNTQARPILFSSRAAH